MLKSLLTSVKGNVIEGKLSLFPGAEEMPLTLNI